MSGAWTLLVEEFASAAANLLGARDPAPFDPYLGRRWVAGFEVHLVETGRLTSEEVNLRTGPALGLTLPFALVSDTWDWAPEGKPAWDVYPGLTDFIVAGRPAIGSGDPAADYAKRARVGATFHALHTGSP